MGCKQNGALQYTNIISRDGLLTCSDILLNLVTTMLGSTHLLPVLEILLQ
jgi:hypothetical protein